LDCLGVICLAKDKSEEIDFERIEQISTRLTEVRHPNVVNYYSIVGMFLIVVFASCVASNQPATLTLFAGNDNQIVILMEKVQTDTLRNYLLSKPNRYEAQQSF
jgi:hypothetical protein